MAAIRNSISLNDRMSPVLRSMLRAMDDTLKTMQRIDRQASRGSAGKSFQTATTSINRANKELDRMDRSLKTIRGSTSKVSSSFSKMGSSGFNLTNLASALYLIKNIGDALSNVMEAPDLARATQARLGLFNESKLSNAQLYDQVFKTALNTRSDLNETGNLVTRIMVSGAMSGENSALGALKVTDIINKALVAGGGTSEENNRALLQLSQGLASGVLQGDELRSLREQVPYLTDILAKGLGNLGLGDKFKDLSVGDMKKLGSDGELTTDRIIKAFLSMEDKVNNAFETMPKTFGQAMTSLTSIWDYFLYELSLGQGPLAQITEAAWELVDFLTSPQGDTFLTGLGDAIGIAIRLFTGLLSAISSVYTYLVDNTSVVGGVVGGLAAAFTVMGAAALVAWIQAAWPVLLVVALVGVLIYTLLELGYTVDQITGSIAGGFMYAVAVIWDVLYFLVIGVVGIVVIIWDAIVWIAQGLISLGAILANAIIAIIKVLGYVVGSVVAVIELALSGIVGAFHVMSIGVLGILGGIATAIDTIFGSNLADTINTWKSSISGLAAKAYEGLDPANMGVFQNDFWTTGYVDMQDASTMLDKFAVNPNIGLKWMDELGLDLMNPNENYDSAYEATRKTVDDFFSSMDKLDLGTSSIEDILAGMTPDELLNGMTINGGDLDSVGKINGSVDIAEEDLQLLRDVAAKEFLLNMTQLTPQMSVQFGDVRETVDIAKLMEVIEEMSEQALGSVLVENY